LPSDTRGGSPVREIRSPGSVQGVPGDMHSYCDRHGEEEVETMET
jgi:hypothetical protein